MRWRRGKGEGTDPSRAEPVVGASAGGEGAPGDEAVRTVADSAVQGERAMPSVNKERSLQSRANNILALLVVALLGGGFLFWWFSAQYQKQRDAEAKVQQERQAKAAGEMKLPPLGPVEGPRAAATDLATPPDEGPTVIGDVLGPAPPVGNVGAVSGAGTGAAPGAVAPQGPPQPTPAQLALQRKLSPSALYRPNLQGAPGGGGVPTGGAAPEGDLGALLGQGGAPAGGAGVGGIGNYLTPTATPATAAQVLASRRFVIPKGNFVDCTLETAIDSQLPGLVTCVTAFDIFGADGKVVLVERGSKLVGESKGEVRQGMNRVFVLWTEARTPTGVVVHLASPGTDELGRAGLPGYANTHFWERFGAAILISVIDVGVAALVQSQRSGGGDTTIVYSPQGTREVMTEILRNTLAIPPTIVKNQGERIQVLVARDVDFRPVYELRTTGAH